MTFLKPIVLAVIAIISVIPAVQAADFGTWLQNFKSEARARGISDRTLESAFGGVAPIDRVLVLDRKQPEHKIDLQQYQRNTLTPQRIAEGRRLLAENWNVLHKIEQQYGVQAQYIVALWGMETSYGRNTGGFDIIASLATLAWEGRRGPYFRDELLKALRILQEGHVAREDFKGSWAGAMGQVQFMPTSWLRFAVDYDGDGHKNIWTDKEDAFASAANYLSRSGWVYGERWGREVSLPSNFNPALIGKNNRKSLSEWSQLGVRNVDGSSLPQDGGVRAFVVKPTDDLNRAYLGYTNLATIMKWNNSSFFALSVGQLADQIAASAPRSASPSPSPSFIPSEKSHYNE